MESDYNFIIFKSPVTDKLKCKVCLFIYNQPYQTECGCRCCFKCLADIFSKENCQLCGYKLTEKTMVKDKGFQREINNYHVECVECDWDGSLEDYLKHYIQSHNNFICKYCKNSFNSFVLISQHINTYKNGSCIKQEITECIYHSIGCKATNLSSINKDEHMRENIVQHMELVYTYIKECVQTNSNADISQSSSIANVEVLHCDTQIDEVVVSKSSRQKKLKTCENENNFTEIEKNLRETCIKNETTYSELQFLKQNEVKMRGEIEDLKMKFMISQVEILEMQQRLSDLENLQNNGILVWKIENVAQKIIDSKSGKQTSYYSKSFYSHMNGYKMCARIYLNGDGMGRGTHVSVFFVLMKGEHDTLLNWPFSQKVTFILIDQMESQSKENVVDAFRPDPKSDSFKRPTSDMNIASGIPLFCSLIKLHSSDHRYIKDDTMFLKVQVDTHNLVDV